MYILYVYIKVWYIPR